MQSDQTQTNNKDTSRKKQANIPLPGLPGLEAAALQETPAGMRAALRMELGRQLAAALLGGRVDLAECEAGWDLLDRGGRPLVETPDGLATVDLQTGELEALATPWRAARYAALVLRAAEPDNHLVGILDDGEAGEYLGGCAAWKSSLRLDPTWCEAMGRRSRGKAREGIRRAWKSLPKNEIAMIKYPMKNGQMNPRRMSRKLLTLTQPRHRNARTLDQIRTFNSAFALLRKCELWTDTVYAGVKGLEDHLTPDGPDVHGHLALISRFINRHDLQREWWIALNKAWKKEYGEGMEYMPGGLPMVDIRAVRKKGNVGGADTVSFDEAIDEVCKYITKGSDLVKPDKAGRYISGATLLELCDIARWPRMFELLGTARNPSPEAAGPLLDTSCISGGRPLEMLDDFWSQAQEPEERDKLESLGLRNESKRGPRERVEWQWNHAAARYEAKQRARPPTWRELMTQLPLAEWLHLMMGRARAGINFRLGWIAEHNPRCFLADMAGVVRINQTPAAEMCEE